MLLRVIHRFGGWTVPARVADEQLVLPLDISLGTSEPLLPAADPTSVERMLLERHLPQLMADARHVADAIVHSDQLAAAAAPHGIDGLCDRRRVERWQASLRDGEAVVALRLDGLATIADADGPGAAGAVVQRFATCLKGALRSDDEAVRLGGDEFAVLLRATDEAGAAALIERVEAEWAEQRTHPVDVTAEVTAP